MKRVGLVLLGCLLLSLAVHAGHYFTNDTGADATGLRVVFSEPVSIDSFGDAFTEVAPSGTAREFIFSGGVVTPWGGVWFNQTPTTANVERGEWLTGSAEATASVVDSTRPLTYEEIMAKIAKYAGPDEPLYVPAEGEQIWLTDLEGHADIYDNDSIKINYALGFDKSQITRIDVYRNGVKMRFVPAIFDVLTNEQMKTFDGNPAENTPASDHTDHAIAGYEYRFVLQTAQPVQPLSVVIHAGFSLPSAYRFVNLPGWYDSITWQSNQAVSSELTEIRSQGWNGIQLDTWVFIDSLTANDVYISYYNQGAITCGLRTPTGAELARLVSLAKQVGLQVEVRICLLETRICVRGKGNERGSIAPESVDAFFKSYGDVSVTIATAADSAGADILTVFVEMNSMERYERNVRALLDRVDAVFHGRLAVDQATHQYLAGVNLYDSETDLMTNLSRASFWDWRDDMGRPLIIMMNNVNPVLEAQTDQRVSVMVTAFVRDWRPIVEYYRSHYPENELVFGEMAINTYDGAAMTGWMENPPSTQDWQENADAYYAVSAAVKALGLSGMSVEYWRFLGSTWPFVMPRTSERIFTALMLNE